MNILRIIKICYYNIVICNLIVFISSDKAAERATTATTNITQAATLSSSIVGGYAAATALATVDASVSQSISRTTATSSSSAAAVNGNSSNNRVQFTPRTISNSDSINSKYISEVNTNNTGNASLSASVNVVEPAKLLKSEKARYFITIFFSHLLPKW